MKWFNTYRAPGECFIRLEPQGAAADKTVLLIHGWGVRASSMRALGEALTGCGCTVYNYDYPTSRRHIAEHAAVFLKRYRALAGTVGQMAFILSLTAWAVWYCGRRWRR